MLRQSGFLKLPSQNEISRARSKYQKCILTVESVEKSAKLIWKLLGHEFHDKNSHLLDGKRGLTFETSRLDFKRQIGNWNNFFRLIPKKGKKERNAKRGEVKFIDLQSE